MFFVFYVNMFAKILKNRYNKNMKKLLLTLFALLFFSTTLIGGGLIFAGCNETHFEEPGGGFDDSENEDVEVDLLSDDDVSASAVDFSVQMRGYTSAGIIDYQEIAQKSDWFFNIYWFEGDGGSNHGTPMSWGNIPLYMGDTEITTFDTSAVNLVFFDYSYIFPVQRYAALEFVGNQWIDGAYFDFWGVDTSPNFAPTFSERYNGRTVFYIYGNGSAVGSNEEPTTAVGGITGDYYIKFREKMSISYDKNGGKNGPGPTYFYAGFDCELSRLSPSRTGYTFNGWRFGNKLYQPGDTIPWSELTGDENTIVLTADWTADEYEARYHYRDRSGNVQVEKLVRYYGNFSYLDENNLSMYDDNFWEFQGWSLSAEIATLDITIENHNEFRNRVGDLDLYAVSSRNIVLRMENNSLPCDDVQWWNHIIDNPSLELTMPPGSEADPIQNYTCVGWTTTPGSSTLEYIASYTYTITWPYNVDPKIDLYPVYELDSYENLFIYRDYLGLITQYNTTRTYGTSFNLPATSDLPMVGNAFPIQFWGIVSPSNITNVFMPGQVCNIFTQYPYINYSGVVIFSAVTLRTVTANLFPNYDNMSARTISLSQTFFHMSPTPTNLSVLTSYNPTRPGYKFMGWATNPDAVVPEFELVGSYYSVPLPITSTQISLYAVWEYDQYSLDVNVVVNDVKYDSAGVDGFSFDVYSDGVQIVENAGNYNGMHDYGAVLKVEVNSTKIGYYFSHIKCVSSNTTTESSSITVTQNAIDTVIDIYFYSKVLDITLKYDNDESDGVIYLKYDVGWFIDEDCHTGLTQIDLPQKIGYDFAGFFTVENGLGTQVFNENAQLNEDMNQLTTENISLFANWIPKNECKYDEENDYWYVEMGYFPQTKVTDTTLKNNIKTNGIATGGTYKIVGQTLTEYEYGNVKYALYKGEYYEVEPVRYILAGDYSSGYATETGSVTAVSEKIVFASVFQTGWTASDCLGKGYNDAEISANVSGIVNGSYMESDYLNSKTYTATNFKMANGTTSSSNITTKAIASNEIEIQSVFGDLSAEFSDLMADILDGYLFYWTRDVGSNLNNAQTISAGGITGTQMKLENTLGVRVTINIKTLACE